jgi:hypothetical protein
MDDDPLDKLAARLKASKPPKKVSKTTRTLNLVEPEFSVLQEYCKSKGVFTSEIIDVLIKTFLDKIKDELPPK